MKNFKSVLVGLTFILPLNSFQQVKVELLDVFAAPELVSSSTEKAQHVIEKPKEGHKYLVVIAKISSSNGEDGKIEEEKVNVFSGEESYPFVASYDVEEGQIGGSASDIRYDEDTDLECMVFMIPNAATPTTLQLDAQSVTLGKIGTTCKLASEKYTGKIIESAIIESANEDGYYSWSDREGTAYTQNLKAVRGGIVKVKVSMTVAQYAYEETNANFVDRGFVLFTDKNVAITSLGASRDGEKIGQNYNHNCYKKDNKAVEFFVFFAIGDLKLSDLKGYEITYKGTSIGKL
ncbi:MAG: hypothetical protein ABJG68_03215 [Crocinitomicaceae bacterium]